MKKIIAIMLALAFVLAFSACKKADDDNSGADETSTVSSAEATSIEALTAPSFAFSDYRFQKSAQSLWLRCRLPYCYRGIRHILAASVR